MYESMEDALEELLRKERSRQEVEEMLKLVRKLKAEELVLKMAGVILSVPGPVKIPQ